MNKVIFAGLILLSAAGCSTPAGVSSDAAAEKEYVTGSNIPRRDRSSTGVKTVDPAELEKMRSSVPGSGSKGN
jgi:hypothetical protein